MASLESEFTRDDIETLIESMSDWEMIGNQEYHLMQMIRNAPMPPEDHEAFEMMDHIKDHFRAREKEINESRVTRQEKAVFLKAKLMMARRDMGINQLFDFAAGGADPTEKPSEAVQGPEPVAPRPTPQEDKEAVKVPVKAADDVRESLQLAEHFIRDLGVWDHYQKFLQEQ